MEKQTLVENNLMSHTQFDNVARREDIKLTRIFEEYF